MLGNLSHVVLALRRGPTATTALLALALVAWVTACPSDPVEGMWEVRTCSDEEWALIDHSLTELHAIEDYMDEVLGRRFEDAPPFAEMVDALMVVRSEDKLMCAAPAAGADANWSAMFIRGGDQVLINVESEIWEQATSDWARGQEYGVMSAVEVIGHIAASTEEEYASFQLSALVYFRAPGSVCRSLAHEAAHLVTRCCDHDFGDYDREPDFVDEVGQLAYDGIYFERWHPEKVWIDQVYRETRSDTPPQSNSAPPRNR